MKKIIPAMALLITLGLHSPAQAGWGSARSGASHHSDSDKKNVTDTVGLNQNDNRYWLIEADYLFWKPVLENCEFAMKTTPQTEDGYDVSTTSVLKQPSFSLSSGVRLGIGFYSPDSWDVSVRGTYLYAGTSRRTKADTASQMITPEWFAANNGVDGLSASAQWKMNYFLVDFTIGREFFLTKRFSTHPFIGLRTAAIYLTNRNNYVTSFNVNSSQLIAPQQFQARENIWGIGPRIGLDINFYLSTEWAFLGGLAGSLLYTQCKVKEEFNGSSLGSVLDPIHLKFKEKSDFGRTNVDAYFGLGWNRWFNSGSNRVSIALMFEAQQWFNLNQFFSLDYTNDGGGTSNVVNVKADKNHGDLSLLGGTLHFQIDF